MFLNVFLMVVLIDMEHMPCEYSLLVPGVTQKVNAIILVTNESQKSEIYFLSMVISKYLKGIYNFQFC